VSFVITTPDVVAAAATYLASIGSTVNAANAAAAVRTTGMLDAADDEVFAAVTALFGAHAQEYQALSAQAAAFHEEFVQAVTASGNLYAGTNFAAGRPALRVSSSARPAATAARAATPSISPVAEATAAPVARADYSATQTASEPAATQVTPE
jgi:hypothetical protein